MYFPYSQQSPEHFVFSSGDLLTNIVGALESLGWSPSVDDGITTMSCASPQDMNTQLDLWKENWGGRPQVKFRFGVAHPGRIWALADEGRVYQMVANQCQLFLSSPGVLYDFRGSVVCGGVPFVFPNFTPAEWWWACGDFMGDLGGFAASSFRYSLLTNAFRSPGLFAAPREAYFPSNYCTGGGRGCLYLETFTGAGELDYQGTRANTIYLDGSPIYIPALLAWGATNESVPGIRAIIWDAMVGTGPAQMDATMTYDGSTWINFTHEQYFGSLYLLMNPGTPPSPVASGTYTY